MVVDDDPVNLQAVLNFLTLDGYSMMAAMDGEKAWDMIQMQGERLSLVIVDIMLPGLSGYELCRRIRKQWTELELPVLMMTAVHGQQALQTGFEAGTNDYLTKPFEAVEFRARVRTLLQIKNTMTKVKEAELAFLQAQIKPHFLYNTLNTISTFCIKDPRQARDLIGDFATYLRYSFDFHSFGETVSLDTEIELVQAYLNIEQARFGKRLNIDYRIDTAMGEILIPQLTIQPLAENAVRHGVMRKSEGGTVIIEVRQEEGTCRISVRDDGVGMSEEQIAAVQTAVQTVDGERKGIGLKNIHTRLHQRYGRGLNFLVVDGTDVFFTIPIKSNRSRNT